MDKDFLLKVTNKLQEKKWYIKSYMESVKIVFNEDFTNRFFLLPEDFKFFVSHIKSAVSNDEQSWFLCFDDYNNPEADSFQWDQYEKISLDAAKEENDSVWVSEIKSFWDCYLPIMISLRSGYSYIAIGVCDNNFGKIFHGIEPDFEKVTLLANSLTEFLGNFINEDILIKYPYSDFI
jgi:hypothetical protein